MRTRVTSPTSNTTQRPRASAVKMYPACGMPGFIMIFLESALTGALSEPEVEPTLELEHDVFLHRLFALTSV
jgi:hypothetical protein